MRLQLREMHLKTCIASQEGAEFIEGDAVIFAGSSSDNMNNIWCISADVWSLRDAVSAVRIIEDDG